MLLHAVIEIPISIGLLVMPGFSQHASHNGPSRSSSSRPQQAAAKAQPGELSKPDDYPGERRLRKLEMMTPEQREKALANLPPERRQQIEQKLERYRSMSPEQRQRALARLERFHALPPERQEAVRRSLRTLQQLPTDRKTAVRQEMNTLRQLPPQERESHMNSDEFRGRYSESEQQMMHDLAEVLPDEI